MNQDAATVWGHYYQTVFKDCPLGDCSVLILGFGFVGRAMWNSIPNSSVLTRDGMLFGKNRAVEQYFNEKLNVNLFANFSNGEISKHLWRQVLRKYDVVINTVADTNTNVGISLFGTQVQTMVDTNFTLPVMLAKICQEMNIVFVNISTACLLPDVRDGRLVDSADIEQAESPYYATKMLADNALRNMDCVITVRPRLIYDCVTVENQRTRTNLTHRVQNYHTVYDCQQSFTHRYTLTAAIVHLIRQRLDSKVVSCNETYNVTDIGLASIDQLSANPDVEVVPCERTIGSFSPIRIIQADIKRLTSTGFVPIQVGWGIKEAQISAACLRNSSNSSPIC